MYVIADSHASGVPEADVVGDLSGVTEQFVDPQAAGTIDRLGVREGEIALRVFQGVLGHNSLGHSPLSQGLSAVWTCLVSRWGG